MQNTKSEDKLIQRGLEPGLDTHTVAQPGGV